MFPIRRALAGLILALGSLRCAPAPPAAQTLYLLADRAVEGLDPHTSGGLYQTQTVLANLYEGLVDFDARMALTPALAVSWSSPDDSTWVFVLRPGVRFHCGGSLEAEDVVFSLKRARDHPRSVLRTAMANIDDVEALPGSAVRIRTGEPDASLPQRLREVYVVSRRLAENEQALASASCGTGPYALASPPSPEAVDLKRFEGHWRAAPPFAQARFVARSYGDADLSRFVPAGAPLVFWAQPGSALFRKASREATAHWAPHPSVTYLSFDLSGDKTPGVRLPPGVRGNPFLDRRVREAVSFAIDREAVRRAAGDEKGLIPTQMVAPLMFGFDRDLKPWRTDPGAARALLSQTPFAGGFEVDLDVRELMDRYGPPVAASLDAIGIRTHLRTLPDAAFFERLSRQGSSMYILRFSCRMGDSQEFFDKWVHSRDARRGYGEFNYSYQKSPLPDLDAEIEAARGDLRVSSRIGKLRHINARVVEERLAIPLLNPQGLTFVSPGIDWTPRADGFRLVAEFRP